MNSCSVDIPQTFNTTPANIELILSSPETRTRGPHSNPPCFFRHLSQSISLSVIFEIIKRTEIFTSSCKVGAILPLLKSGSRTEASSCRPVILLNIVSKVLEKCIYDSVYSHCITKLSIHQHGFTKKRSNFTNLLPYLETSYKHMGEKLETMSTFYCDFSKAFDKVPHKFLLTKLYAFSIRGQLHRVIESYLSNRRQFVRFDRVESHSFAVKSVVPQRSLLESIFFMIFINDPPNEFKYSLPYFFADDLKFFHTNLSDLHEYILKFEYWVEKKGMQLASKKSFVINFQPSPVSLYLYREPILVYQLWKSDPSFHVHFLKGLSKANSVFRMVKRNVPQGLGRKSGSEVRFGSFI